MNTLPTWLELLRDRLAREIPWFASELDAAIWNSDFDAIRAPILVRILKDVALPAVTADHWGVRDAVRGAIDALWSGGTEALRKARSEAAAASWAAAYAASSSTSTYADSWAAEAGACAARAAEAAASAVATYAAEAATYAAASAFDAASHAWAAEAVVADAAASCTAIRTAEVVAGATTWRKIADIVLEEVAQ